MKQGFFRLTLIVLTLCTSITALSAADKTPAGNILIITGENNHAWKETTPVLRQILEAVNYRVKVSEVPAVLQTDAVQSFDGILINYNSTDRWEPETESALLQYIRSGKGLIIVHAANNAFPGWREYEEMAGLIWVRGTAGHDRYGPMSVRITNHEHFITRGLEDFEIMDELYHTLTKFSEFTVLADAYSKQKQQYYPMILIREERKGRVFHTCLGHAAFSMHNPGFIITLQRGTDWAIKKERTE